jgi:hypothetical protein
MTKIANIIPPMTHKIIKIKELPLLLLPTINEKWNEVNINMNSFLFEAFVAVQCVSTYTVY